jgi:acetyltransferase-like isoleucine patch superfamily enzyme
MYGAGEIEIGEGFYCGPACMFFSSLERLDFADGGEEGTTHLLAKTTLEDESRLGVGAIITLGSTLGRGSILGANSVLLAHTKVPPMELWAGTPARKLKDLNPETWRSPKLNL